jgi:hypothetical protein
MTTPADARPVYVNPPEALRPRLEVQGYWALHLDCTAENGDPDPGRVTFYFPGELLEDLPRLVEAVGPAAAVALDEDTLRQARAEWLAWRARQS